MADCTDECGTCLPKPVIPKPDPSATQPTFGQLGIVTEETLNGKGVFDSYMRAGSVHLQDQYDKSRIKGADYAKAYSQMVELMMTQANQYVLTEYQSQIDRAIQIDLFHLTKFSLEYDVALKEMQVSETMAKTSLVCAQESELLKNGTVDRELKEKQILETEARTKLTNTQESELVKNGVLDRQIKDEQILELQAKTSLTITQEDELIKNGLIDRELKANQVLETIERTKLTATQENEMRTNGLVDRRMKEKQILEIEAKTALVTTQESELILNGVKDRDLKTSQIAVQGAQKLLYERQTVGFDDKRDNDNLKIVTDAWSVQATEMNPAGTGSEMAILYPNTNGTLNGVLSNII